MTDAFLGRVPWQIMDGWAWLVVLLFLASALLASRDRGTARRLAAGTWVAFAGFWLVMAPHFLLVKLSIVEGALSLAGVPACLYAAHLLYSGRDSLLTLTRGVAFMGLIYLPFVTVPWMERGIVELATRHIEFALHAAGFSPEMLVDGRGFRGSVLFVTDVGSGPHRFPTRVLLACTGIGTISIFGGIIAALDAPLRRKLKGLGLVVPLVWVLNVVRVSFISLAHGKQWLRMYESQVLLLFSTNDPNMVSFLLADKVISQILSVVALVVITFGLVRVVPELVTVVEDVLYLVTGTEYDLEDALDVEVPERRSSGRRAD